MADSSGEFLYNHIIDTSFNVDFEDDTDVFMEAALLIHTHNKNQHPQGTWGGVGA
jgi:hypothetical protein